MPQTAKVAGKKIPWVGEMAFLPLLKRDWTGEEFFVAGVKKGIHHELSVRQRCLHMVTMVGLVRKILCSGGRLLEPVFTLDGKNPREGLGGAEVHRKVLRRGELSLIA